MSHTFDIRVGGTVSYDGAHCTIIEVARDAIVLVDSANRVRRVRLMEILRDATDAFGTQSAPAVSPLALLWAEATDAQRDEAQRKASHVRELRTGFASGLPSVALPGEPRPEYNLGLTSIHERRQAKAVELGIGVRTVKRWEERFDDGEDLALLDLRKASWMPALSRLDPRWIDICQTVVAENVRGSRRTVSATLAIVEARVKREHPGEDVRISPQTPRHVKQWLS